MSSRMRKTPSSTLRVCLLASIPLGLLILACCLGLDFQSRQRAILRGNSLLQTHH